MNKDPKYITFGKYSGYVLYGNTPVAPPADKGLHLARAAFLASQCEGPKWGTVQSYDGCGMSGGLLHNIAVLPTDRSQGTLFALVEAIRRACASKVPPELQVVLDGLRMELGARLSTDGFVYYADGSKAGQRVPGEALRTMLSGPMGVTTRGAPNAVTWIQRFNALLASPVTYEAQYEYSMRWLADTQRLAELTVYRKLLGPTLDTIANVRCDSALAPFDTDGIGKLGSGLDLALCVYHAHSVNAPGAAAPCLANALPLLDKGNAAFAGTLIRLLGKKDFARWRDMPGENGGDRYDATRRAAKASGLWPASFFEAGNLMPMDL